MSKSRQSNNGDDTCRHMTQPHNLMMWWSACTRSGQIRNFFFFRVFIVFSFLFRRRRGSGGSKRGRTKEQMEMVLYTTLHATHRRNRIFIYLCTPGLCSLCRSSIALDYTSHWCFYSPIFLCVVCLATCCYCFEFVGVFNSASSSSSWFWRAFRLVWLTTNYAYSMSVDLFVRSYSHFATSARHVARTCVYGHGACWEKGIEHDWLIREMKMASTDERGTRSSYLEPIKDKRICQCDINFLWSRRRNHINR